MATRRVDPLQQKVPIVDPQTGSPTPFFMRVWNNNLASTNASSEEVAAALAQITEIVSQVEGLEDVLNLLAVELIAGTGLTGGGVLGDFVNITFDLADTTVTAGNYGGAASGGSVSVPYFTVDDQGRLTAADDQTLDLFYDVVLFVQGKPTNAELVLRMEVGRAFTLPASLTGSQASARVASTSNVSFDIKKNGSSIGSVVFNVSASGTFTFSTATSFAAGDLLEVVAPSTADATLEDISITFVGTR